MCGDNPFVNALRRQAFLLKVLLALALARLYPPFAGDYLATGITSKYMAVMLVFFLSGLGLETREIARAFGNIGFTVFVQAVSLAVVPCLTFGFSRLLLKTELLQPDFADGLLIAACLPMTVKSALIMTVLSGGDEAAALLNTALGSLLGVFVTPAWIQLFLGQGSEVKFLKVVLKLVYKVLLPVVVGQIIRNASAALPPLLKKHKAVSDGIREWGLVFMIYCAYCKTFQSQEYEYETTQVLLVAACVLLELAFLMGAAWLVLNLIFGKQPELVVMGFFGCHHKTVAMGLPLIKAIYEEDPKLGFYLLPLLMWHPGQLLLGSMATGALKRWA